MSGRAGIHPQALIHPSAQVDSTAWVGPGALIGAEAVIGAGCRLEAYSVVGPHTRLGPGCQLHPFAVIGGPAQDRRTDPDAPFQLICGADNIFREGVTVSRGSAHGGGLTRIGSGNLLMAQVHVGHDCVLGDGLTLANGVSLAGHVQLGDQASLGGHAAVHQFARIGTLAFVAANAMVSQDIPPYCLAAGDRATLRGLNTVGLRRAGVTAPARAALGRAFHLLFGARRDRAQLAALCDDPQPEVARLARFVVESARGIARARIG